jgi:hypothetical protein
MQDSPAGTYTPTTYQGQAGYLDASGQIISGTGAVLYRPPGWQEKIDAINAAHPSQNALQTIGSGISAMASNPVVQAGALLGAGAYFLGPVAADLFGGAASATAGGAGGGSVAALVPETVAAMTAPGVATAPTALTPAAIESLTGTAGYGANASALTAANAAGIPAAQVGANALSSFPGVTPQLTPAAIDSLMGTPGYGTNAAAQAAATAASVPLSQVGSGANLDYSNLSNAVQAATSAASNGDPSLLDKLKSATGLTGTQLAALASGATSALTAVNTSNAIGQGLKAQQDATTASQGILKGIYDQQLGFQKPYQATGLNALNQIGQMGGGQYQQYDPVTGQPTTMGTGTGYLTHQFDKNDLAAGLAPNYDFMLQQGQMANQRAANVGGGALSGNTLQGLQNYTQNYAGNAYQNAFQNYQTQRNNIYNNLSNMAGIGQTANTGAANAGTSYGTGVTGLNTGLANATAASILGQAQVAAGGANSAANATFLSSLLGQTGKVPATTPTTA